MAISVVTRPEKTLSNGFLSKWNSSELPLRYEFDNNLYPINTFDSSETITNVIYNSGKQGTVVTLSSNSYVNAEFVTINGTGIEDLDGGNFQIKDVDGLDIVLDVRVNETSSTGTTLKYYRNYLGLAKVFVGAREGHPYNTDDSKPLIEVGTIEIDFTDDGVNNIGYADVKSFIKPDVNADFDYTDENRHLGWTSFHLQLAESYDKVEGSEIVNYTSDFEDDEYDNCVPFDGYEDDSFDNGLTDWLEVGVGGADNKPWVGGVGSVSVSITQNSQLVPVKSNILYQNITLINNNTYQFDLDIVYSGDSPSSIAIIYDSSSNLLGSTTVNGSGVYTIFVTPNTDVTGVGVSFGDVSLGKTSNITLNEFISSYNGTAENLCLAFNYAVYGCKQFQDNLGGNFGDYVLNIEDTLTPKILTHFNELSYFYDKPFYLNSIIPNSTFSLSEDSDNVFVSLELFDSQDNNVLSYNYKIDYLSDGVYTVDPNIKSELDSNNISECDWSYANVQFIIIPGNTFIDANNGTFEGGTIGFDVDGITIFNSTPNEICSSFTYQNTSRTGSTGGTISCGKSSMDQPNKVYTIFENDSSINVVEGRAYELLAYVCMKDTDPDPRHINNGYFYFLPNGYTYEECTVSPFFLNPENLYSTTDPTFEDWYPVSLTFEAKTTDSLQFTFYEELNFDIDSGTGYILHMDDITFKGPIEYISESKKVNNKCSCSPYGVTLRWLNDLGGFESWYFDGKAVYSENVTQKVNIKRDITSDWDNTFINGDTQNDNIKTNSNKSILVRSQLLTKNEQEVLQQIRRSVKVQLLMDSGKWQTVTINQGKFVINEEGDKTRDISFEISLPDTIIQQQ